MIATGSVEEFRGELQGLNTLALAADPDLPEHQAAAVALGLNVRAEHDAEPACDHCGRSAPPAGLEDQSLGGPPVHECWDSEDCARTRAEREPMWLDKQFKFWKIDWDKYRRMVAYQQEQAAHTKYGGGIYALSQNVDDPQFVLALAHVRDMADAKAPHYEALFERVGELQLTTAALPGVHAPATPQARPEPVKFDPWGHTLAAAHNRTHLLGHHRQHPHVHDAASALARKKVQADEDQAR
jgi:hypothetical protein